MTSLSSKAALTAAVLLLTPSLAVNSADRGYLDRFTYEDNDILRSDQFMDYSPRNWNDISCNEGSRLEECLGYRDKWETGRDWQVEKNYCRWCPEGEGRCSRHHQSPIDLKREVGYEPGTHESANECIDVHWMKYEDSFCTWDQLIDADAFTIERHALRIAQPITVYDDFNDDTDGVRDGVKLNCRIPGKGSRFGRIDYSKGFSQWWHLSHIDIHTPSEHTQDGVRYDAEVQLQHFYSVTANEAGVNNEMGTVSVFMNAYDDAPPYRYLDKIICQWRRKEWEVRKECGLEPIETSYPGCFPYHKRNLRTTDKEPSKPSTTKKSNFQTAHDVILHNYQHRGQANHSNTKIFMEDINWGPAEEKDWDAFIAEQSAKMDEEEALYHRMRTMEHGGNSSDVLHEQFRNLIEYDEIEWFNYWPMLGVRTEYYFRYSGTQTIPPCYGNFVEDTREGTNHWRVMKDPIRIHKRQLQELQRLIADRISPKGSPVNECQADTAAKVQRDGNKVIDVNTARPLMEWEKVHFKTFCECKDWDSKWPEDRKWCRIDDVNERFYDKKYNFGW